MFVDHVKVHVGAGKGGDGIVTLRREKYVACSGPSGGDGEAGGDVVFMVDEGKTTLPDLCCNRKVAAESNGNGKTKEMHGADEADCIIKVPQGTLVKDEKTGRILADLTHKEQKEVAAKGGKSGHGNFHSKPSKNTAPQYSELGAPGEERDIMVKLKVPADIGLIGFPSVGKSTLLSVVSEAKPEIVECHSTTLAPSLGMMQVPGGRSFVMADLPGLIEGASEEKGLRYQLLRHIEHCHVIIHVVDMGVNDGRDLVTDYKTISDEPEQYEYRLIERPQIILTSKMDLDGAQEGLKRFRKACPGVEVFETTAIITEGLGLVFCHAADLLETTPRFPLYNDDASDKETEGVLYKFEPEQPAFGVYNMRNGSWELNGEELERSFKMSKMDSEEDFIRFACKMWKVGIDEALRKASCKDGDVVTICDIQSEFVE